MRTTIPFIIFTVLAVLAFTHVWLTFHETRRYHRQHFSHFLGRRRHPRPR